MFAHTSIWGVLLAALSAMVVGVIWYSPFVLGKSWTKATGVSEKTMASRRPKAMPVLIVGSLVTAYALSLVISYLHSFTGSSWYAAGLGAALLTSVGFGITSVMVHDAFDTKEQQVATWINSGNRIVTYVVMSVILAAFLSR